MRDNLENRRSGHDRRWTRDAEPEPGPPIAGVCAVWASVYGVLGLAWWATGDVLVGSLVGILYAVAVTAYVVTTWR